VISSCEVLSQSKPVITGFNMFSKKGFTGVSKYKRQGSENAESVHASQNGDLSKGESQPSAAAGVKQSSDDYESYFDINEEQSHLVQDSALPLIPTKKRAYIEIVDSKQSEEPPQRVSKRGPKKQEVVPMTWLTKKGPEMPRGIKR
jgi:hypothetical protein